MNTIELINYTIEQHYSANPLPPGYMVVYDEHELSILNPGMADKHESEEKGAWPKTYNEAVIMFKHHENNTEIKIPRPLSVLTQYLKKHEEPVNNDLTITIPMTYAHVYHADTNYFSTIYDCIAKIIKEHQTGEIQLQLEFQKENLMHVMSVHTDKKTGKTTTSKSTLDMDTLKEIKLNTNQ